MKLRQRARGVPPSVAATVLFSVLAALFFDRVLFRGETFFSRDIAPFFYPMKHFLAATVRAGHPPLWNPLVAGGEPFFAALQPGLLYPGSLLLYLLPMPAAFDILVVVHYPLAGLGVALLLRRWGHGWPAAVLGGTVFMLGGFLASVGNFVNNLQTVAWLPWIFLVWDRFLADRRVRDLLGFAALCGIAFLGGEPQMLGMGLALIVAHGLLHIQDREAGRLLQISVIGVAGVLAVAIVAVQFLPFAEYMGQSVRRLPIELSYAASRSLEPASMVHLLIPPALETGAHGFSTRFIAGSTIPWVLSAYVGGTVLAVAALGVVAPRSRRWIAFWGCTGLLGIVLALGVHSPLYRALFAWVPPFRPFRYPEKFLLLTSLSLAVLAAGGADRWMERPENRDRRGRYGGALLLAIGIAYGTIVLALGAAPHTVARACGGRLAGALLCEDPDTAQALYAAIAARVAVLVAALGVIRWMHVTGRLRSGLTATLLVAVVAVDLGLAHRRVNPSVESEVYVEPPWTAAVLSELMEDRGAYRYRGSPHAAAMGSIVTVRGAWELSNMYLDYQTMGPNVGQIYGFPMQDGLQGVELISVALTNEAAMRAWSDDPLRFLQAMNVRYYADATSGADSIAGLRLVASNPELPIRIYEVPDPVPRAYVTGRHEVIDNQARALRRILEPDFPLGRAVVLEAPPTTGPDPKASGTIIERADGVDRVRLRVRADGPAFAVLTDRFYPGWKATVDGEDAPVVRANGVFRAVAVPPGVSEVEFRFRPGSVRLGGWISLAGLIGLVGAWSLAGGRRL